MNEKLIQQQAAREAALRKGKGSRALWIVGLFILTLLIIALPTVLVVFFGMLPSLVAYIIDRSDEKYSTFCVSGMNFAGVFPYLMDLWSGDNSINAALEMLTDVFSLVVMYSASGFGWMMFMSIPPVIVAFLTVMKQRRVVLLRNEQRALIEEWGPGVAAPDEEELAKEEKRKEEIRKKTDDRMRREGMR